MQQFHRFFAKNSYTFGALLGLLSPLLFYFILQAVFEIMPGAYGNAWHPGQKLKLLSIAVNLLWMRYYLVGVKQEITGKTILVVTFLLVAVYFIFYH
jgi:hypothetical protein